MISIILCSGVKLLILIFQQHKVTFDCDLEIYY